MNRRSPTASDHSPDQVPEPIAMDESALQEVAGGTAQQTALTPPPGSGLIGNGIESRPYVSLSSDFFIEGTPDYSGMTFVK
jgi:hypothetical protein